MAKKAKTAYVCDNCGYESVKWMGCCPSCGEWNTLQEIKIAPASKNTSPLTMTRSEAKAVGDVDLSEGERYSLFDAELDLIFGGGIVVGSVILLGGEPGIGKSTFLMQAAATFAMSTIEPPPTAMRRSKPSAVTAAIISSVITSVGSPAP